MSGWQWWTFMAVCAAVFVGSMVIVATVPTATKAEMRLCDKAVWTVLSSTDPVELQRAGIMVRNLRCGIGLRLDDAGAFKPRVQLGAVGIARDQELAESPSLLLLMPPFTRPSARRNPCFGMRIWMAADEDRERETKDCSLSIGGSCVADDQHREVGRIQRRWHMDRQRSRSPYL
jgi:hypothetical protein